MVGYTVVTSVMAALFNVAINLLLIPRYGALVARIGTWAPLVLHNPLEHAGLGCGTGTSVVDRRELRVGGFIAAGALALVAPQGTLSRPRVGSAALVAVPSTAVLLLTRPLHAAQTSPQMLHLPLLRRVVG